MGYLLELAVRRRDAATAREVLTRIDAVEPTDTERTTTAEALASVAELRAAVENLDADWPHP